ncbi:MAG: hypothetical protein EZS28_010837 [Streblomastix strix]|uniref:RRM domain-containing protein n=1 Tax=Streblomastix strix TaxID=222440 RepID=A0A5J4WFY5_9EUKA|nr:MAG: hypothetical protein EZS28_010837 [Streblomastix strix]
MLSIIVALTVHSLGYIFYNDHVYYYDGKVDKDGVVTLDAKDAANITDLPQVQRRVTDFPLITSDTSEYDLMYFQWTLQTDDIAGTNVAQALTAADIACQNTALAHRRGFYGLLGFTQWSRSVFTHFPPSVTYLIHNGPTKITYKNVPDALKDQLQEKVISQSCDDEEALNYLSFGLLNAGLISSECVSNAAIPTEPNKCNNGKKVSKHLKGYRFGNFYDYSARDVKGLIIRFGAVLVDDMVLVGWGLTEWKAAISDGTSYKGFDIKVDDDRKYSGYVIMNITKANVWLIVGIVVGVVKIEQMEPNSDHKDKRMKWTQSEVESTNISQIPPALLDQQSQQDNIEITSHACSDQTNIEIDEDKIENPVQLFIFNLNKITTEQQLREHFALAGAVEQVFLPQSIGQNRGFGFITMKNQDYAENAVDTLDKTIVDGNLIIIYILSEYSIIQSNDQLSQQIEHILISASLTEDEKANSLNELYEKFKILNKYEILLKFNSETLSAIQSKLDSIITPSQLELLNIIELIGLTNIDLPLFYNLPNHDKTLLFDEFQSSGLLDKIESLIRKKFAEEETNSDVPYSSCLQQLI